MTNKNNKYVNSDETVTKTYRPHTAIHANKQFLHYYTNMSLFSCYPLVDLHTMGLIR